MTDLITDSKTLKERITPLNKEPFVTVDTEFLREKTYYPLVCLVQIGGKDDAFAVDPMADDIDLEPLYKLLANKRVVKVFHSCSQDIEIFYNLTNKIPANVFDTQIAAQMLGYGEAVGYGNLVKDVLNRELDKSSRHTDWSARPLTDKQIDYAMGDVTHLREVYEKLIQQLKENGREKWVKEETKDVLAIENYENNPKEAWKRIKMRSTKRAFVAQVASLARWREERAQRLDKPRNWVMKNDAILEIATTEAREPEDLQGLRFFDFKRYPDLVDEVLEACKRGRRTLPPRQEKKKPMPKGAGPLMELLKVLLRIQAEKHDVAPSVIAKVSDLEEIAKANWPRVPAMRGWRYEIFGKYAAQLKKGDLAITVHKGKTCLIEPAVES